MNLRFIYKKRPFTLLEVLIALGLMSIVLYTLFSSLVTSTRFAKKLETIKPIVLEKAFAYQRLTHVISQAKVGSVALKKIGVEVDASALTLTFTNQIDPELIYSGEVKGEISLEKGNLILTIWGKDSSAPPREEVLLRNIDKILFEHEYASHFFLHVTKGEITETYAFFPSRPHQLGWDASKIKEEI